MHRRLHGAVLLLGWLLAAVGGGGGGQPGLGTMMLLGLVVRAAATPVPTPVPSAEGCYANEVLLDFFAANVTVNNLGGVGPNAGEDEELRYSKIGVVDGEDIDLVVTTTGEGGTYETESPERNGKSGKFGQLNMQVDTSAGFRFKFEYTADWKAALAAGGGSTTAGAVIPGVRLPVFTFTVFDLDNSRWGDIESVCVDEWHAQPAVGGDLKWAENSVKCDGVSSGASIIITANAVGLGCDNPDDPLQLGLVYEDGPVGTCSGLNTYQSSLMPIDQLNRTAEFVFRDSATFNVTFGILGSVEYPNRMGDVSAPLATPTLLHYVGHLR
jgi:hypothetical protein